MSAIWPATSVLRFASTTWSTLPRASASALMAQTICSRQAFPTRVFDTPSVNISPGSAAAVVSVAAVVSRRRGGCRVSPAAAAVVVVSSESSSLHAAAISENTTSRITSRTPVFLHRFIRIPPPWVNGRPPRFDRPVHSLPAPRADRAVCDAYVSPSLPSHHEPTLADARSAASIDCGANTFSITIAAAPVIPARSPSVAALICRVLVARAVDRW